MLRGPSAPYNLNEILQILQLRIYFRPHHWGFETYTIDFRKESLQPLTFKAFAFNDGVSPTHRGLLDSATSVRPLANSLIPSGSELGLPPKTNLLI